MPAKTLHGFSMTKIAAKIFEDPRPIKAFVESLIVQNNNFAGTEFVKTMDTINTKVREEFGHRLTILALDCETGDPADEFSDILMFQIDYDAPSKRLH